MRAKQLATGLVIACLRVMLHFSLIGHSCSRSMEREPPAAIWFELIQPGRPVGWASKTSSAITTRAARCATVERGKILQKLPQQSLENTSAESTDVAVAKSDVFERLRV